jgi:integrase
LNAAVIRILRHRPRLSEGRGLAFTTNSVSQLSGISRAKKCLDFRMLELARADNAEAKIPPWVAHDLRRTAASDMARLGFDLPVIDKIPNHTSGTFRGIVGAYQHHDFLTEKRIALERWSDHVTQLVDRRETDNVIILPR